MINELKIVNFRSITSDKVILKNNLTTVIGSNGTGKTNLILALKFIASCLSESPVRAIQRAGGLDKVFSVRERRAQKCSFQISISRDPDENLADERTPSHPFTEAVYFFELMYDESQKNLKISKEKLTFKNAPSNEGVVIFERNTIHQSTNKISGLVRKVFDENGEFPFLGIEPNSLLLSRFGHILRRDSTYPLRKAIRKVWLELASIIGYNFDPQALRKSADLLSSNELAYDGKGFAAIINRLKSSDSVVLRLRGRFEEVDGPELMTQLSDIYQDILPFLAEVNSSEAIDTTTVNLEFTEKHQVGTQKHFSSENLSDGTMKFLAIATAILMPGYSLLFIEELENYLNPKAIRRLIQLMRDTSSPNKRFILTTHSETILNLMRPSEILVSRRDEDGSTYYTQFEKLKEIDSAIDSSGMSLGTIWAKGGLDAF
ncbi:AAA family ATPase [Bdellovibrio sp. GT3]|uniref:AAA family ATPase n=1 Tax=Bdellovibrio sp. GT3 TaxID=3136282 RepID=UPI0030F154A2